MGGRDPAPGARAGVLVFALVATTIAGCSTARRPPVVAARELPLAPPATAIPTVEPPPAIQDAWHVVRPGETLWRIARSYGVDPADLARANDIADPGRIAAGQRLLVPGVVGSGPPATLPEADRFVWPVAGRQVLSFFGAPRGGRSHAGLDIGGTRGDAVLAMSAGRVVYASSSLRGYGKTVIVDHGNGLRSLYAHNASLLVQQGQTVDCGQPIARVGRSGNATTEHLHFEILRNGIAVDPLPYLASNEGARE